MLGEPKTDYCGTHRWICTLCTEETKRLDEFVATRVRACQRMPIPTSMETRPYKVEILFGNIGASVRVVCKCGLVQDLTHDEKGERE